MHKENDMTFPVGQVVKYRAEFCRPQELDARMVVVENNGDRLIVRHVCNLPLPPTELVRDFMIVAA
jgi:hypothetical protein